MNTNETSNVVSKIKTVATGLIVLACVFGVYAMVNSSKLNKLSNQAVGNGLVTDAKLSPMLRSQLQAMTALAGALPVNGTDGLPASCSQGQVLSYAGGKVVCVTLSMDSSGQVSVTVAGVPGTNGIGTGVSGSTGTSGSAGAKGTIGTSGTNGTSGTSGLNGTAGSTGTSGTSGTNGGTGTVGATGAKGATGSTGLQGAAGAQGTAGVLSTLFGNGITGTLAGQALSMNLVTDANGGLHNGSAGLSLLTSCTAGQTLGWNGTAWTCASGGGSVTTASFTSGTAGVTITGGTNAVVGSGTSITIATASGSATGLLTSADWTTFSNKESALSFNGRGMFSRSGNTIAATTSCTANQVLKYDGTTWVCTTDNDMVYTAGTGINISGSSISLQASGVSAGTYGNALSIPVVTLDANGRVTGITSMAIAGLTTANLAAAAGITNGQLAHSDVTVTAGSGLGGGGNVALGGTIALTNSGLLGMTVSGPLASTGGQNPALSLTQANGSSAGYVSAADYTTFINKQTALAFGNLTSATGAVSVTGGTGAVIGASGAAISVATATGSQTGLLNSVDWTTFNNKESALTFTGNGMFSRSGNTISATTSCSSGQVLSYNGSAWTCTTQTAGTTYTAAMNGGIDITGSVIKLDPGTLGSVSSVAGTDKVIVYDGTSSKTITYNNLFSGVLGSLNYRGTWNASTDSPTLTGGCSTGTKGYYYAVATAGSTNLDGISTWNIGDWVVCNGTVWQRIQTANGVSSVFGRAGAVTAANNDYTASQITNAAAGNITSTDVQSALNELDTKKVSSSLASGLLFVGNASNVATGVALSGDATITNAGLLTVSTGAITSAKIADGTIAFADLASNSCSNGQVIKYSGSAWTCGTDIDTNTTYTAGTGLSLSGTTFNNTGVLGLSAASTGGNLNSPLLVGGTASNPTVGLADASTAGQYWAWDGSKWALVTPSASLTAGTIDSQTKSANGVVISGNSLYLQTADASNPGLVSTGTQTLAGNKTLTGDTSLTGNVAQSGNKTFATGTGAVSLNGATALNADTTIAANKAITALAGSGAFDFSAASGSFKTSTGANTLGGDTTVNGTLTVGGLSTFNGPLKVTMPAAITDKTTGGALGSAAATVDSYSAFNVNQTTTGQTLTIPSPTVTTAGRLVYVNNVGSAAFTILGTSLASGNGISAQWNGSSWSLLGGASSSALTIGTLDGQTATASGATIASNVLYLQSASATNAGLVNTTAQTFAGNKTFNGNTTLGANSSSTLTINGNAVSLPNGMSMNAAAGQSIYIASGTTGALTLDSGTTGAISIGTGANGKAINIGNASGNTLLTFLSGNNAMNFTSNATNGGSGFNFTANSITFGDVYKIVADSLSAGSAFKVSSASTAFTGNLASFGLTGSNVANTGTVLNLNAGTNANALPLSITSGSSTIAKYTNGSGATTGQYTGVGSPEGVVAANVGSTFNSTDTGSQYVKTTGTGNTGWTVLGAGVAASYMQASLTGVQDDSWTTAKGLSNTCANSCLSSNNHIGFNKVVTSTGSDITLNTSSTTYSTTNGAASYARFTLKAGKTYYMTSNIMAHAGSGSLALDTAWYDATAGQVIGSGNSIYSPNGAGGDAGGGVNTVVFAPSIDTLVEMRITNSSGLSGVSGSTVGIDANRLPSAYIQVVGGNAPVVGQTVDLIAAALSADQSAATSGSDIVWNTKTNGNMALGSGGTFTLLAGKTYSLQADLRFYGGTNSSTYLTFDWVDATTNTALQAGSAGFAEAVNNTSSESGYTPARLYYTPTANQTVKVRVTGSSGSATIQANYSHANVTQIGTTASTGISMNYLVGALAAGSLDNTSYTQTWNWSALGANNGLVLATSDTTATGALSSVTSASAGALTAGGIVNFNFTGTHTGTSGGFQLTDATAAGTAMALTANSLTSGYGFAINSSATALTGSLANITLTGNNAGNTGSLLSLSSTGTSNGVAGLKINVLGSGLALDVTGNIAYRAGADYTSVGTQNDVVIGTGSNFRLNPASALTVTGLSGGTGGRVVSLVNASSQIVTINNQTVTTSTAANRIVTGNGASITLNPDQAANLQYDATASRWRVLSTTATTVTTADTSLATNFNTTSTSYATVTGMSVTVPSAGTWVLTYATSITTRPLAKALLSCTTRLLRLPYLTVVVSANTPPAVLTAV